MNGPAKHDDALVQKILASVRQMQVEREALKWRCRDLGNQVQAWTSTIAVALDWKHHCCLVPGTLGLWHSQEYAKHWI